MPQQSSNPAYSIGALVTFTGSQGFLFQASSPRNVAQKAIALSNLGEASVVQYYDQVLEITCDAIIPNATTACPQAGDIVEMQGIQAPTPGSTSTFKITGMPGDIVRCFCENPSIRSTNKEFQMVSFTAWRGLANGVPGTATAT